MQSDVQIANLTLFGAHAMAAIFAAPSCSTDQSKQELTLNPLVQSFHN